MAPDWIALDEITAEADVEALTRASYCGVRFFASAHADGPEDLARRPVYRRLLDCAVFDCAAVIQTDRSLRMEPLGQGLPGL